MNISVYITSYNQKAYLREAIESVLAQTLPPGQIIIVDDNSSDSSQDLIEGYRSRYPDLITPIFHEQNKGVAQVRVTALQAVSGDHVTYLDGDDRYLPEKLEQEAALLKSRPEIQIAYSNNYYMTAGGRRYATWVTTKTPPQGDAFLEVLTRRFPRGNPFRMELVPYALWQAVGFHDTTLDVLEDWEMRIRLGKHYRVGYCDQPLTDIRVHTGGLSNVPVETKLRAFDAIWGKYEPLIMEMDPGTSKTVIDDMNRIRASFIRQQAKELLGAYGRAPRGDKGRAWDYYRESWRYHPYLDLDLLLGLALPSDFYLPIRSTIRRYFGQGDGRFNRNIQPSDRPG